MQTGMIDLLKQINEKLDVIVAVHQPQRVEIATLVDAEQLAAHLEKNSDAIRKVIQQAGMSRDDLKPDGASKLDLEQHVVTLGKENTALKLQLDERQASFKSLIQSEIESYFKGMTWEKWDAMITSK